MLRVWESDGTYRKLPVKRIGVHEAEREATFIIDKHRIEGRPFRIMLTSSGGAEMKISQIQLETISESVSAKRDTANHPSK